jgi:hypothetical protein
MRNFIKALTKKSRKNRRVVMTNEVAEQFKKMGMFGQRLVVRRA